MTKKRSNRFRFSALFFTLLLSGCGIFENSQSTKSGSGSSSGSTVTSQELPPHGQATVNLLERAPFQGKELDPAFWSNMEAYCKAGPTQLILADMLLIPSQMIRAGFTGRNNALYYALSRTVGGANWNPGDDTELKNLKAVQDQIDAWWSRYIRAVVQIMQKAPRTTAVIIVNDAVDHCGRSLGNGTYKQMTSVLDRVSVGDTVPD